jgi:hypothetical protein
MREQDVVELFHHIEYGAEPPLRMYPETWLPAGRRAARRRRALLTATAGVTAAGVTALAVGLSTVLGGGAVASSPAAAPPGPASTATHASPARPQPAEFDPLTVLFTVDLPQSMRWRSTQLYPASQTITATNSAADQGSDAATVVLHARAHPPAGINAGRTPAPAVSGHQAWWWCPPAPESCGVLVWQWAPGAWASAVYVHGSTPDQALTLSVAAKVRMVSKPQRFAFVTARPGGLSIAYTVTRSSPSGWMSAVTFGTPEQGHRVVPGTPRQPGPPEVGIVVSRFGTGERPNTTIGGYPARVTDIDGINTISSDRDGYSLYLGVRDYAAQLGGAAGVRRFFENIHVVPNPGDRSTWTATPIR